MSWSFPELAAITGVVAVVLVLIALVLAFLLWLGRWG